MQIGPHPGLPGFSQGFWDYAHAELAEAAKVHNFPLVLLRLSLAAYRLPRALGISGVYQRVIMACRGITAGSGFATTELRVLMHTMIATVRKWWWATVDLKVYVDDLSLSASGSSTRIVRAMRDVLRYIAFILEHKLHRLISVKKS